MRGASVLSVLVLTAIAFGQSPNQSRQRAEVEWLWSNTRCTGDVCQTDQARVQAEWLWAQVKSVEAVKIEPAKPRGCQCGPDCSCGKAGDCQCTQAECYTRLRDRAVKEGRPLVVGVGCDPPRVEGCLSCRYDALTGYKDAIVVGKPQGKELLVAGTVHCKAKSAEILAVVKPKPILPVSIAGS